MKQNTLALMRFAVATILIVTCASYTSAQTGYGATVKWTGEETKVEKIRRQIDIDMTVPDYKTTKIDQTVMGWRLAKMIEAMQSNYQQSTYN